MTRTFQTIDKAAAYYAPSFKNLSRGKMIVLAAGGYCLFLQQSPDRIPALVPVVAAKLPAHAMLQSAAAMYCFTHGQDNPDGSISVSDPDFEWLEANIAA